MKTRKLFQKLLSEKKQNDFSGLKAFLKQYPDTRKSFLINPVSQYREEIHNISIMLPYIAGKIVS